MFNQTMIIFFLNFFLIQGCITYVNLTEFKQLPTSDYYKRPVEFKVYSIGAYQRSCFSKGKIHHWQDGQWEEVNSNFKPSDSATPFFLDGQFSPRTGGWNECDLIDCNKADSSIFFDLAEYLKTGEKPNPQYKNEIENEGYESIPKMVPEYKSKPLSGRFKVTYIYYTSFFCDPLNSKESEKEFEFEIP